MSVTTNKYETKYFDDLVRCIEELQDYKISIDPDKFAKRKPGYGQNEAKRLINSVDKNGGQILLVMDEEIVIGCGACALEPMVTDDNLEFDPIQFGEIKRLYIHPDYRGQGLGKQLFDELEKILLSLDCSYIALDVLKANTGAHSLYSNMGYTERYVRMLKKVKTSKE